MKKKNASAPVWDYFGFTPDEKGEPANPDEAVCTICLKKVAAKDSNTSNLHSHLKVHHPITAAKLKPSSKSNVAAVKLTTSISLHQVQPTISGAFSKSIKYTKDSHKWKTCTEAVARYIAKDMVSFHTVEQSAFRDMVKTLDPQYEMPGRKYFSQKAIPELYNNVREEVKSLVLEASNYALTTDMWSAENMAPYMSLTAHIITSDWELESKCLQTSFFPENHTAENISDALRDALEDWGLDENKLSAITTDNAANITAAITKNLKWPWLNCFGHNLNLAVTNALADQKQKTERALGVCRTIIAAFSHSWPRKRELKQKQQELGLPEHSLITVSLANHYSIQIIG